MSQFTKLFIDGFWITADKSSYLVHIERSVETPEMEHKFADLPEWVLNSPFAIWLAVDGDSIFQRAVAGDSMKEELVRKSVNAYRQQKRAAVAFA